MFHEALSPRAGYLAKSEEQANTEQFLSLGQLPESLGWMWSGRKIWWTPLIHGVNPDSATEKEAQACVTDLVAKGHI